MKFVKDHHTKLESFKFNVLALKNKKESHKIKMNKCLIKCLNNNIMQTSLITQFGIHKIFITLENSFVDKFFSLCKIFQTCRM